MSDVVITTHGLSKRYLLGESWTPYKTLRETIMTVAGAPLRAARGALAGQDGSGESTREFWALRDLNLEVRAGEVVGLIGRNGAGKSTLLKLLSRVTEPTLGHAEVHGRVGSLLEVGTGFHPELTGRENVYLFGAVLGMRRREIREHFDAIVEFAEVERFLDTPVKFYSSGMYVRLAFAVAAHLQTEIMIVDEVLAVGDAAFQKKCLGKMSEVAEAGRTVLFVSHNLAVIRALCSRGILLERGSAVSDAPVDQAVTAYLRTLERAAAVDLLERTDRASGDRDVMLRGARVIDDAGETGEVVVTGQPVRFELELTGLERGLECELVVFNSLGHPVFSLNSELLGPLDERPQSRAPVIACRLDALPLILGRYRLDVVIKANNRTQDGLEAAATFDVQPGVVDGRPVPVGGLQGDVFPSHRWIIPRL